jgi:hypothetical protein
MIVNAEPAAPELVLSDVRGPTNATRSQFDSYYNIARALAAADTTYRVNKVHPYWSSRSPYFEKTEMKCFLLCTCMYVCASCQLRSSGSNRGGGKVGWAQNPLRFDKRSALSWLGLVLTHHAHDRYTILDRSCPSLTFYSPRARYQ